MRVIIIAVAASSALLATNPRVKRIDGDDEYVAVRTDAFMAMEAAEANLPACETSLAEAQELADAFRERDRALTAHIAELDAYIAELDASPEPTAVDDVIAGWEQVDGLVGLGAGWGLGTAQCLSLAWVFNRSAFGGGGQ